MLQYIRDKITAVYLTDATGAPTQVDMLDGDGVSLLTGSAPVFQVPNAFAVNQWSLATGSGPKEITINVSVLPAANGSPITAIQYRVGTGAWVTLDGTGTGARTVAMQAASTAYDISLRAVNIVGAGNPSTAKSVTSGAPAATAPAAFGPAQWTLATGTGPAELALNILSLPADGGSPITALEYRVGSGSWVALDGAETGPRAITMPLASTAYSISLRAVNAVGAGAASAAKTATSGAPALAAPSVETPPSITGPTTVGGILTRTAGTATGNPAPSRATVWLRNGDPITGQTGNTLDTTGFAVDDAITTRDVWTNSQGTATGTSDPVTLTVQPTLQATISPDPLVAGQPASITFSEAPDTVTGNVTFTGTGKARTFTAPSDDTVDVAVSAKKAGYQDFLKSYDVQPAPAALAVEASENIFRFNNANAPVTVAITAPARYAGSAQVDPAALATGPKPAGTIALKTISGQPVAVGQVLELDLGPWDSLGKTDLTTAITFWAGTTQLTGAIGNRYTIQAGDGGKTITGKYSASDTNGTTSGETAGVAVPAAGLQVGVIPVGVYTIPRGNAAVKDVPIDLGDADPAKVIYVATTCTIDWSPTLKIIADGVDYPLTQIGSQNGAPLLVFHSASIPAGGAAILRVTHTQNVFENLACHVWAAKGMTKLANPTSPAISMTAGTAQSWTVDTQVGDVLLIGAASNNNDAAGLLTPSANLIELADIRLSPTNAPSQFAAFMATETQSGTGRIFSLTSSQSGIVPKVAIHLRRA